MKRSLSERKRPSPERRIRRMGVANWLRWKYRNWRGIPHGVLTVTSGGPEGSDDSWVRWIVGLGEGESQLAELAAEHGVAREVVDRYNTDMQPFALWLRAFDLELLRLRVKSPLVKRVENVQVVNPPGAVERLLAASFAEPPSVITIGHPGNSLVPPAPGRVPRLQIIEDDWRSVVTQLAVRAALVVIEVAQVSPGLREELAMLAQGNSEGNAAPRTVVVLHDADSAELKDLDYHRSLLRSMGRVELRDAAAGYERPARDDPAIRAFSRVVSLGDLAAGELERIPAFADLLFDMRYAQRLDPAARRRRNDSLAVADEAVLLATDGRLGEATSAAVRALEVFADLDDVVSVIGVAADLAFTTYAEGDTERARQSADWFLRFARRLTGPERAGLCYRFGGIAGLPALLSELNLTEQLTELRALFGVPG
jgi:hypothetical protein